MTQPAWAESVGCNPYYRDMPQLPAFCEKCGTAFPSGFAGSGGAVLTFVGNRSGPCPNCGAPWGRVPDGMFQFFDEAISILSASGATQQQLSNLAAILQRARAERASPVEVANRVEQEQPAFRVLADFIRRRSFSDWIGFLVLLLTLVNMLERPAVRVTIQQQNPPIEQIIDQVIKELPRSQEHTPATPHRRYLRSAGISPAHAVAARNSNGATAGPQGLDRQSPPEQRHSLAEAPAPRSVECARRDSNPQLSDPKSDALSRLSYWRAYGQDPSCLPRALRGRSHLVNEFTTAADLQSQE